MSKCGQWDRVGVRQQRHNGTDNGYRGDRTAAAAAAAAAGGGGGEGGRYRPFTTHH